jgi:hypothetical protein
MAKRPTKAWKPEEPYNQLPTLPPGAVFGSSAVLKATLDARVALAELERAVGKLPRPGILLRTLALIEARCSSEIEGIKASDEELLRGANLKGKSTPSDVREASHCAEALLSGYRGLGKLPIGGQLAEQVCVQIKGRDMPVRNRPGTVIASGWRIIYTPPVGESRIRGLLANWESYMRSDEDIDPLIRMAVAHYQFEAIHPFTDGNGRTGRVLNSLYLVESGVLEEPILCLSRYILANRPDYYRLLNVVRGQAAWEEWVLFMVRGVTQVARWTVAKVREIHALVDATQKLISKKCPDLPLDDMMRAIFEQPYCRIRHLVDAGVAKRETASIYLAKLSKAGVLTEIKQGRDKLFLNHRLVALLTS